MQRRQQIAKVAGTHLYYESIGNGPCLVLIHGFSLDSGMWDDQIEALCRRYRVIRYDMRGFGRSALPGEESYSAAADLKALLDYLEVESAAILGLSLGGGVALDFALMFPEATSALILAGAMMDGWRWSAAWNEQVGTVWAAGRHAGVEAAKKRWLALPLFLPSLQQPEVARRLAEMVAAYSGWHWVHRDPQRHLQLPAGERLGSIAAPTLIVIGERDVADFRAMADALHAEIRGSQKAILPGVGHMVNMEAAEPFNALVLDFLGSNLAQHPK